MSIEPESQRLLAELRGNPVAWSRIAYQPGDDVIDENRSARAQALLEPTLHFLLPPKETKTEVNR